MQDNLVGECALYGVGWVGVTTPCRPGVAEGADISTFADRRVRQYRRRAIMKRVHLWQPAQVLCISSPAPGSNLSANFPPILICTALGRQRCLFVGWKLIPFKCHTFLRDETRLSYLASHNIKLLEKVSIKKLTSN